MLIRVNKRLVCTCRDRWKCWSSFSTTSLEWSTRSRDYSRKDISSYTSRQETLLRFVLKMIDVLLVRFLLEVDGKDGRGPGTRPTEGSVIRRCCLWSVERPLLTVYLSRTRRERWGWSRINFTRRSEVSALSKTNVTLRPKFSRVSKQESKCWEGWGNGEGRITAGLSYQTTVVLSLLRTLRQVPPSFLRHDPPSSRPEVQVDPGTERPTGTL